MSQIFEHWKCDNCNYEFNQYVSFGHPQETFIYKWKCSECNGINELKIYGQFALLDCNLDIDKLVDKFNPFVYYKSDSELRKIYNGILYKVKRGY